MSPPGPPAAPAPVPTAAALLLLWGAIAACLTVEGALQLADRGLLPVPRLRETAYEYGAFWSPLLRGWRPNYALQPWTMFLSYAVLHGGLWHLVFNMLTLWSLGRAVALRAGALGLGAMLLAGTLGGGVAHGVMASGPRPMVGASGALFGLAAALLTWAWRDRRAHGESLAPVLAGTAALVGINLVMWWALAGELAWQAHLGGALAGALAASQHGEAA